MNQEIPINLFVYGNYLTGFRNHYVLQNLEPKIGILSDYRRIWPPDKPFPIILQDQHSFVRGEFYQNIPVVLLQELDWIEGEGNLFHRIKVLIQILRSNSSKSAYAYYPSSALIKEFTRQKILN
ncbi:gamma-glutamylcyclotransferase family protein [Candidatus Hodarchaeum mangrovi]